MACIIDAKSQGQDRGPENYAQDKDHEEDNRSRDQRDGDRRNEGWGGNYCSAPPAARRDRR